MSENKSGYLMLGSFGVYWLLSVIVLLTSWMNPGMIPLWIVLIAWTVFMIMFVVIAIGLLIIFVWVIASS
jgi:hypothetical protein